jgi:DNA-directed RNA polymerase specialized sigma24 family protein
LVEPLAAQDVYLEVIAACVADITSFKGTTSVHAWLFSIARVHVLYYHHKNPDVYTGSLALGYVPIKKAGNMPGVQLKDVALEKVFNQLKPCVHEVLQLSLWHGLLLHEIAYVIEKTEAQVRKWVAVGLHELSFSDVSGNLGEIK